MGDAPMNSTRTRTFSSVLIAVASWGANSHAWAQTAPSPSLSPPAAEGGGATIAAVVVVVGLLMVIGVVVKLFDLKQRRGSGAGQLQTQIFGALFRETTLARLPVTTTVHLPGWEGTPATIRVVGRGPTPH